MNIAEFLERARGYAHLIKEDYLLADDQDLQRFVKGTMSVFVVDKRLLKIYRSHKDTVKKSLESLGCSPEKLSRALNFPCGTYC